MDYNKEIPFEKRPASGFYDTAVEVTYNSTSIFVDYSNLGQYTPASNACKDE